MSLANVKVAKATKTFAVFCTKCTPYTTDPNPIWIQCFQPRVPKTEKFFPEILLVACNCIVYVCTGNGEFIQLFAFSMAVYARSFFAGRGHAYSGP